MNMNMIVNTQTRHAGPDTLAARPVIFDGCAGFFRQAGKAGPDQAVLFVSPWGFEELSVRKFWRVLADLYSEAGIASLRFDLPGTGNSLDVATDAKLEIWQDAVVRAAAELRRLSGASRILLVTHGLGAMLAASVADRIGPLSGIALLAPVTSGRLYLRELAIWARITDGKPDPEKELREGRGFWISGFRLPDGIVEGLRKIDLPWLLPLPVKTLFVATREDRSTDEGLAVSAQKNDHQVTRVLYEAYDSLVSDLNFSKQPEAVLQALLSWSLGLVAKPLRRRAADFGEPRLVGDGFVECPVLIGPEGRLASTLCLPADRPRCGATVVLLSTAYHPSAGWGRTGTETARRLAREGIPCLRFDSANTGDSPPLKGAPAQIIYSPAQDLDVAAALDFIDAKKLMPAIIGGRCSGGYLAFRSLLTDHRLSGAVCANTGAFYWDGSQNIEDLMRFVPKPLGNYSSLLFKGSTWKRLVSGKIEVRHAVVNVSRILAKRALHASETVLRLFPFLSKEHLAVHNALSRLEERQVPLTLLYSNDDPGIAHLVQHFGKEGRRINRFRNISLRFLQDTDHNLSTPEARDVFVGELLDMARRFQP